MYNTTQVEVTLHSAVVDDCTTLAAAHDTKPEAKQLRLNHQCRLMTMVAELWLRRPVTIGYADWLCRQARETNMLAVYNHWLRELVMETG